MSVKLRQKNLKDKKISLYLDIYHNGIRKIEYLKLYLHSQARTEQKKAENKEVLRLAESIKAQREILINTTANGFNSLLKLKTKFFDFAEMVKNEKLNSSTNRDYISAIKHFKDVLQFPEITIGEITFEHIENYKNYLSNSKLKTHTQFNYLAKLKTIFKEAVRRGLLEKNPAEHVKNVKINQTFKDYLTIDEVQKLKNTDCKSDEVKRAFLFSCNTGLRFSDLKNLTYDKIIDKTLLFEQQKTKEQLYISLNNNALELIKKQQTEIQTEIQNKVFKLSNDIGYCNKFLKEWCNKAGINKNLTFHIARHTFATNLLIYGADISVVSKLLGHTSLKHTLIYAKVVNQLKINATNNLPDFL